MMKPFRNKNVKNCFKAYTPTIKNNLLSIRQLIFDVAAKTEGIGELQETLKWNQPSYMTVKPKSGTTIRLGCISPSEYAIYVHCQTTLIADFRELYSELQYEGNRAIIFNSKAPLPKKIVGHFIYLALSYHLRKKSGIGI